MLIDKQEPPSDENISIRQSDSEILIVFRGHLFTIVSPFSRNLCKVPRAVTETPSSRENNFIRMTESNLVVCSHFLHLSYRSRILRLKTHRQQQSRPREVTSPVGRVIVVFYSCSSNIFRLSSTVLTI
jgi:hypothetical protein